MRTKFHRLFLISSALLILVPDVSASLANTYPSHIANREVSGQKFKNFLGNNFNPSINVGVGGSRLKFFIPSPSIKVGPVQFRYLNATFGSLWCEAFQFDLDLFTWNRLNENHRDYLTVSYGEINSWDDKNPITYDYENVLAGITRYNIGSRLSYSAKIGITTQWKSTLIDRGSDRFVHQSKLLPMGELNISCAVFKYGLKQSRSNSYKSISSFFNPYLSFGAGADRALVYPSLGVKIRTFHLLLSAGPSLIGAAELVGSAAVQIDLPVRSVKEGIIKRPSLTFTYINDDPDLLTGLMYGFGKYKLESHFSRQYKLGVGYFTDGSSFQKFHWLPIFGLSWNIHMFKFHEKNFHYFKKHPIQNAG
ncbi:MAG: hypothetical protein GC181_02940 [Bacteroidetes bacterium]|nr:hypothetical protein [Bacteroidota bacterium]